MRTRCDGGKQKLFIIRRQRRRQSRQVDQVSVGQELFVGFRQLRRRGRQRRRQLRREAVGAVQPEAEVVALQAEKLNSRQKRILRFI